jgi:adenine-specific DNA-methyltransferase
MATKGKRTKAAATANGKGAKNYSHPESYTLMRPDVGIQAQFKKKKEPKRYAYDSSISSHLDWDAKNPAREQGEALIQEILQAKTIEQAKGAADKLRRLSKPFLNWAGKAERLSFDVPTLPLFVHERLSTKAILETLKGHKRDKQIDMFDLFGDPGHSITDQVLKAYEHRDKWVNRMILGDSLVVMNSLLQYEGMGGKVQMIYMDPPYGVKFGSNFQPFVRKRDVSHGDDEDMTREPEMVQAYRDTWELGLHSYLTYMRDRLLLCRDLLASTGSIFVQISDENLHHVRELMDEIFGADNFVAAINFKTMMPLESGDIESVVDYLCWYARDHESMKYRNLYAPKKVGAGSEFVFADDDNGGFRRLTADEVENFADTTSEFNVFKRSDLTSSGYTPSCTFPIHFDGQLFETKRGKSWRTTPEGIEVLRKANRLFILGKKLYYKMYLRDFGYTSLVNQWTDTIEFGGRSYVVQTTPTVVQRCMLMTTDPGDLVLDPTCGSGTTAYVAEQWGRRWITTDVSRVPLALARQRLLTATFPWYELKDHGRGPAGGFVYVRRQNKKGEEVGGVVPHIKLKTIANNEPPDQEVLVDKPQTTNGVTRITGPFCVESSIPVPSELDVEPASEAGQENNSEPFVNRMLEVLRKSPVLRLAGNKTVTFKNVRPPAKSLTLSAEGVIVNGEDKPVAFVFGPENGAVTESLVFEAAREAYMKGFAHLFVIGFAVEAKARTFIDRCGEVVGVQATYVQATTDLTMSDLLKTMRSSQIFSVCGLPDIRVNPSKGQNGSRVYTVELLGLDVFDPVTMQTKHYKSDEATKADKVPAWFLDTDYNGLCFHVSQAFFPRTAAWDSLKKALKRSHEDSVWDHLAGTISEPFEAGNQNQIAVKVIDDRGNELLIVKTLAEAERLKKPPQAIGTVPLRRAGHGSAA